MYEWELESIDSLASAQDRYRQANLELGSRKMFFMVDRHPKKGAQPVTVVVFFIIPDFALLIQTKGCWNLKHMIILGICFSVRLYLVMYLCNIVFYVCCPKRYGLFFICVKSGSSQTVSIAGVRRRKQM